MAESNLISIIEKQINKTYNIGILENNNSISNIADHTKGRKGAKGGLNYVKKKGKLSYKELFKILNNKYSFLKKIDLSPNNKDVKNIINFLVKNLNNPNISEKQIENGYLALLINVINRKEFGPNEDSTIKQKGFDFVMKDSGSFIRQLKVWISEGKK